MTLAGMNFRVTYRVYYLMDAGYYIRLKYRLNTYLHQVKENRL